MNETSEQTTTNNSGVAAGLVLLLCFAAPALILFGLAKAIDAVTTEPEEKE